MIAILLVKDWTAPTYVGQWVAFNLRQR